MCMATTMIESTVHTVVDIWMQLAFGTCFDTFYRDPLLTSTVSTMNDLSDGYFTMSLRAACSARIDYCGRRRKHSFCHSEWIAEVIGGQWRSAITVLICHDKRCFHGMHDERCCMRLTPFHLTSSNSFFLLLLFLPTLFPFLLLFASAPSLTGRSAVRSCETQHTTFYNRATMRSRGIDIVRRRYNRIEYQGRAKQRTQDHHLGKVRGANRNGNWSQVGKASSCISLRVRDAQNMTTVSKWKRQCHVLVECPYWTTTY
mmetsp:Transcript_21196/g.58993  ORF Transcript_21196/g.58993 Transcript_21196/m.58993 type:complete len:258 (+) Transcript_21196:1721-2494(+)